MSTLRADSHRCCTVILELVTLKAAGRGNDVFLVWVKSQNKVWHRGSLPVCFPRQLANAVPSFNEKPRRGLETRPEVALQPTTVFGQEVELGRGTGERADRINA